MHAYCAALGVPVEHCSGQCSISVSGKIELGQGGDGGASVGGLWRLHHSSARQCCAVPATMTLDTLGLVGYIKVIQRFQLK